MGNDSRGKSKKKTFLNITFFKKEFVGGWALHGCHTIDSMKKKLKEWKEEIKQPNKFRQFYYYVFDYLREDKKSLCNNKTNNFGK